ncbi:tetratricopeptide repeat protein [Saccharopolyspora hattusasensis]|uniref:tetratricopeptide repeat protein n=1 Tax=Saccharopolyspora hattusasensis TaxID=1128679 RepID=UPI003D9893CD
MNSTRGRTPAVSFGSELRRRREKHGLSLRELAERVYYSFGYLSKLERELASPSLDAAERLDEALHAENKLLELAVDDTQAIRALRLAQPAQLLPAVADHVGREAELAVLGAALQGGTPGSVRTVVVTGGAGVGKTATVLRWAHPVAEQQFPDGQLFVDLGGWGPNARRDPEKVLEEFLHALGVPLVVVSMTSGVDRRAGLFRSLLADRRVLLVLDNAASSDQVLPLLPSSSGCMVVVTSRRRLDGVTHRTGALQVTFNPLAPAASLDLLSSVGGQTRVDSETAAAEAIAAGCGHLPLALRIAVDRCAARPQRSLTELAEDMAEGALDWLSPSDAALGMREAIGESYRELPSEAARVFRVMGIVRGELDAVAAAAMLGWPAGTVRQWMHYLAAEHLVTETARDRYRMADLIRQFAFERMRAEEPEETIDAARRRWVQWYAHSATAASALLAAHCDLPALDAPEPEVASMIAAPADYLAARRWWEHHVSQLTSVVDQASVAGLPRTAWTVAIIGGIYLESESTTRYPDWVSALSTAATIAEDSHDGAGMAWCAHQLGTVLAMLRRNDEALVHLTEAARLRETLDDQVGLAWSHIAVSATVLDMGRYEKARETAELAFDRFQLHGHAYGEATALVWTGTALQRLGLLDESLHRLTDALSRFDELGAPDGVALALVRLSETYRLQGKRERALDHVDRGIEGRRQLEDASGVADGLLVRGQILHDQGDVNAARRAWTDALDIFEDRGDPRASDARARLATTAPARGVP